MLSRHLPLVLLNENSKILGCHSLLCRPLNYIQGILFYIILYFFLILQVYFHVLLYVFSVLLSVQA